MTLPSILSLKLQCLVSRTVLGVIWASWEGTPITFLPLLTPLLYPLQTLLREGCATQDDLLWTLFPVQQVLLEKTLNTLHMHKKNKRSQTGVLFGHQSCICLVLHTGCMKQNRTYRNQRLLQKVLWEGVLHQKDAAVQSMASLFLQLVSSLPKGHTRMIP